ncbi:MAG: hypothetical protein LBE05_05700 [Microbacterium sp.]|jgi:hypothetical protein|nr:hypothetical protein [Microbacterium sp.]
MPDVIPNHQWFVWLHDSVTGDFRHDLSHLLAGGSADDALAGTGSGTVTLQGNAVLPAGVMTGAQAYAAIKDDGASEIVIGMRDASGVVVSIGFAAYVMKKWVSNGQITLTVDQAPRRFMTERFTFCMSDFASGDFQIIGKSIEAAVASVIARSMLCGPLPIDIGPTTGSGGFTADVSRWEITTMEDLLVRIEKYGAEIRFEPYLTPTRQLRFNVRVATKITGPVRVISVTAAATPIVDYEAGTDSRRQLTGTFVSGKGMGSRLPYGWAGTGADPGAPIRDAYRSGADTDNTNVLMAAAASDLNNNRHAREMATFSVIPSQDFPLSNFAVTRRLTVERRGHPILPDSDQTYRITGNHIDLSTRKITPTLELM